MPFLPKVYPKNGSREELSFKGSEVIELLQVGVSHLH